MWEMCCIQITSNAQALGLVTNVNETLLQPATNGNVFIDFSATTTSVTGFDTASDSALLATIYFKANKVKAVTVTHDPIRSKITRKSDSLDILQTIPVKVFTLVADTQAPTVTIGDEIKTTDTMTSEGVVGRGTTTNPNADSTTTNPAVTFTWRGVDYPTRPSDAVSIVKYAYRFNAEAFQTTYDDKRTSVTKTLRHGKNTFEVKGQDASMNTSVPASPGSKRAFTVDLTPKILRVSISHGISGTPITISGYNFGSTKQTLRFGSVAVAAANITSWTDTQIVAKVPTNGDGNISVAVPVTTSAGTAATLISNGMPFTLDTLLRLVFGYQGISQDRGTKKVTVTVKRPTTTYVSKMENLDAIFDATEGTYVVTTPPITRPVATGINYTVSVVDDAHLRRQFKTVPLTFGTMNTLKKKADTDKLIIADFNADNTLSIDDFGLLMAQITDLSVQVSAANAKFDVNGDGMLDIVDIALLLSNYTALEKLGDVE
ncbi:IPT/TIG domain-containing protein [Candidatus Gottesmanbacteria bacterium]|nr:IPT/TIG domain-containing protein [Candidatus Gottesmanbacteria bacterium]